MALHALDLDPDEDSELLMLRGGMRFCAELLGGFQSPLSS